MSKYLKIIKKNIPFFSFRLFNLKKDKVLKKRRKFSYTFVNDLVERSVLRNDNIVQ